MNCILQWSLCKEWCPQCKHPFDYLLTHKQLDGTITDFLTEESVVLLKRARWFEEYMRVSSNSMSVAWRSYDCPSGHGCIAMRRLHSHGLAPGMCATIRTAQAAFPKGLSGQ